MVEQPLETTLDKEDPPSRKEGVVAVASVVFSIVLILGVMAMLLVMARLLLHVF